MKSEHGQTAMWNKLSFEKETLMKENRKYKRGQMAMRVLTKLREPFSEKGSSKMRRGQMAMWVLTKFAMIFFIMALAALLMSFVDIEREGLCNLQASRVTEAVSGALIQVINSPVEDERKVLPLEPALSIGKSDLERYEIKIINHESSTGNHEFRIEVDAANPQCSTGKAVPFDYDETGFNGFKLIFAGDVHAEEGIDGLVIEPSKSGDRSRYIIIIKCRGKTYPSKKYLFIEDCRTNDPSSCKSLDSPDVEAVCGWSEES